MKRLLILFNITLLMLILGCSQERTTPTQSEAEPQGSAIPNSWQNTLDSLDIREPLLYDQILDPTNSLPLLSDPDMDFYAVTFIWGRLPLAPPSDGPAIDWGGSIFADCAKGEVLDAISFEPGQDSLVVPPEGDLFAWESITTSHFDGIAIIVGFCNVCAIPCLDGLSFLTEPITIELSTDQLAYLNAFYPVDEFNGVVVIARRIPRLDCPRGTFDGQWIRVDDWRTGRFNGLLATGDGVPFGRMAGRFWPEGDNYVWTFAGELSGIETDEVKAILRGVWYYDDPRMCPMCGEGHGMIKGLILSPKGRPIGHLVGEFGDWCIECPDTLPLRGHWAIRCDLAHDASSGH
jgi:hypothetical protein